MKDFNFFEPYVDSSNKISHGRNKLIGIIIAIIASLIVVAIPTYIQVRTMMTKSELAQNEQLLSRRDSKEKLEDLEYKEELLASMAAQNSKITEVDSALDEKDIVGSYLIDSISESLPEDVFLNRLSIERSGISMDCVSEQKEGIAFFENNIRRLNYFENIFIPRISLEERFYTFSLDMQLKDGEEGSEDAEDDETDEQQDQEEDIEEGED